MNFTIDDTSPNFVWDDGGVWGIQPPNQVTQNSNFFMHTYHGTQTKGASVRITFVGSAFYLYGSSGPNHGRFSVTYDGTIKFTSGFASQIQYRQLLFSNVFDEGRTHNVIIENQEDFWFDIDFMVLTSGNDTETSTADLGFFASTVTPATAVPSSDASGSGTITSNSESTPGSIFRIITFVLAGIIVLLIVVIVGWVFCRRRRRQRAVTNLSQGSHHEHLKQGMSMDTAVEGKSPLQGGKAAAVLGAFTRGKGKDDLSSMQTPSSMSLGAGYPPESASVASGSGSGVSGAARETLIALNNMGRRPGYRNLPSESGGRETPTSTRSLGSAGQVWIGANANHRESRLRNGMRHESLTGSVLNISQGSDRLGFPTGGRTQQQRGREEDYVTEEIGLGLYSSNNRIDTDQRTVDLRRSASVASSGILDRITSSPPPAVPELPVAFQSANSFTNNNNNRVGAGLQRSASPDMSIDSHTDGYSALSFASKIQHPYGKGNEMLVGSYSSSNNSLTAGGNSGAMPLRPPPVRTPQEDRGRLLKEREREREREQAEQERRQQQQQQLRYSRPPPEYAATVAPTESTVTSPSVASFGLRRQGTRTGDIPIAIEGGFSATDSVDNESVESHSVAYVGTATVTPISRNQPPINPPYAQQQHSRNVSAAGSNASLAPTLTGASMTTAKRAITPDNSRAYTPDRTMAIPSGRPSEDRVWTLEGVSNSGQRGAAGIGRPIMDDRARLAVGNTRQVPRIPPPAP